MKFHQLHRYRQTETSTTMLSSAAAIDLAETFEQELCFLFREPGASVDDIKLDE